MSGNYWKLKKSDLKFSYPSIPHVVEVIVPWLDVPVERYKKVKLRKIFLK